MHVRMTCRHLRRFVLTKDKGFVERRAMTVNVDMRLAVTSGALATKKRTGSLWRTVPVFVRNQSMN
jgi:hypothetical protein